MVLTRYKQRLIFPKSGPDARRYSLLRETYSSRPSPRSQGGLDTSGTESSPGASSIDLSNSNLLLTNPSLGFIRYLSTSIESLGLSTSDIDLYFSFGANLSLESLILSEQEIAIAKTLLLPAEDVVLSSNEALILRSKLLSEDTLINSGGDLSLSRNYLLNQLTLNLASLDISIDASTMLRLIEDNLLLSDVDILKGRLQDLGIDTVALTSEGSFQRILYLNPSLLWLETNTLAPYQPDLTQYLSLDLEVLQLSEVTPALSKLLQLYSDNLQLQTVNRDYSRYSDLSNSNLNVFETLPTQARALSNQPTYLNLYEINNVISRTLIPAIGQVLFSSLNISYSSIGGSEQAKATITAELGPFSSGYRTYYFNGWDTAVTSGELWKCQVAVWTIRQGSTIVKRHFGLDLVHTSKYNGEEVQLVVVDRGGNIYISDPYYTTIGSSYSQTFWLDTSGGSNSNNGLTSSTPRQTASGIFQTIKDNWTPSGEHILYVRGSEVLVSTIPGNVIWNAYSQYVGGSALAGRLTVKKWDNFLNPVFKLGSDVTVFGVDSAHSYYGFVSDGISYSSTYVNGGTAPSNNIVNIVANNNSIGYNVAIFDSNISGVREPVNITGGNSSFLSGNAFKWLTIEDVSFGDRRFGTLYADYSKNVGISRITAPRGFDNQEFGFLATQNNSFTSSIIDKENSSSRLQAYTFYGGLSANPYDVNSRISLSEISSLNCFIAVGPYQLFGQASGNCTSSFSICNSFFYASSTDYYRLLEFNSRDLVSEISEFRISHNLFYLSASLQAISFGDPATSSSRKIRSVMIDNNTFYRAIAGGFYSDSIMLNADNANPSNYVSAYLTLLNNYVYEADTRSGGSAPTNLFNFNASSILESDYNILGRLGSDSTYWRASNETINTWQTNTGFDLHSSAYNLSSHNMVNMSSIPLNFSAATSTGIQINAGKPNSAYIDVLGFVRNSPPEVGAYEWSTGLSKPSWWT